MRVLDLFEELNVMFGQAVRSCALPQQCEVSKRWGAVIVIAFGHESCGLKHGAAKVFDIEPMRPISSPRNAFGGFQTNEVAARDLVKDAQTSAPGSAHTLA